MITKLKRIQNKVLEYIYNTSKQPILLKDLLVANRQYIEGMDVESARLGFKLRLTRAYSVYIAIVLAILVPITFLTHKPLAKIDPHVSIIGAMIITAAIFIGFNYFMFYTRDAITKKLLLKSWKLHFPFFSYEEYSGKVDKIFEQAMKEEVSKRDLEKYILDKLSQ